MATPSHPAPSSRRNEPAPGGSSSFASLAAQPVEPPAASWSAVRPQPSTVLTLEVVAIAAGAVGALALTAIFLRNFGMATTSVAAILALVPLGLVVVTVAWIDRWEPEPRGLLLAAFFWGAGIATPISYLVNSNIAPLFYTGNPVTDEFIGAVVSAPMIEELTKGLGVLVIFLLRPRYFDGVVDGVVYAALSAAGFAFVENILYFSSYADNLGSVFVSRALQGPFAHVAFTLMMGITLGIAARRRNQHSWLWLFPLGFGLAVALHALWNYSTFSVLHGVLYWTLQVPIFVILLGVVSYLRRQESKMIRRRAGEFARAGWLTEREANMLGSFEERARARGWARSIGKEEAMKDMQRTATRLAYNRERAASGRVHRLDYDEQNRLLQELTIDRAAMYGAAGLSAPGPAASR